MKKKMKFFKKILSLSLVIAIMVCNVDTAYANGGVDNICVQEIIKTGVQYVLQCENFNSQCGSSIIDGELVKTKNIATLHDGIMTMLDEDTIINTNDYLGDLVISNEKDIYSKNMYNANAGIVNLSAVVVAENNIGFGANDVNGTGAILYSKNGDITFSCGEVEYTGIIYAPNGNVTFNANTVNVNGVIIAKNIVVRAGSFNINHNNSVAELADSLDYIEINELFGLAVAENKESTKTILQWEETERIASIDIYARYNEKEFEKIANVTGSEYEINMTGDYRIVANTIYGEEILSNVVTIVKDEEGNLYEDVIDTDEDGIPDGYEYLMGTNPSIADTDNDGFTDGYEVFVLYTNPLIVDKNEDYDADGVNNLGELKKGTNPYLADSDFDGIKDNEDAKTMKTDVNASNKIDYLVPVKVGEFDLVSKYIDEEGKKCELIYNYLNGQIKYISDSVNESFNVYNAKNQLTATIECVDKDVIVNTYSYNGDNIETITHNGFQYQFQYDENGNMTNVKVGNRILITNKCSDSQLTEEKYGNGYTNQFVYDENGNVTTQKINGSVAFEWKYDENGNVTEYKDVQKNAVFSYAYNEENVLTAISDNSGFKIKYTDAEDTFSVSYEYKGVSKTYAITESEEIDENGNVKNITTMQLISKGKLVSVVSGEDTTQRTLYVNEKAILSSKYTYSESGVSKIEYQDGKLLEYTYDNVGNIVSVAENGIVKLEYEYDSLGQLIRENNAYANKIYRYKYDNAGNILASNEYAYSNGELTSAISKKAYGYGDGSWKDLLTNFNGYVITYDEIGNPLNYRDNMKFSWEGRQLTSIVRGNDAITYTYNSEGIRTKKIVNGVTTTYNLEGTMIISETTGETTIWYLYDENDCVVGFEHKNSVYYFEKNVQGDVIRIFDEVGNAVSEYVYDSWGNVVDIKGNKELALVNPFRYRSYYHDNETGFYYLQSRYYDSYVGRFLNADVMLDTKYFWGFNLFAYCGNNFIVYTDQSGYGRTYVIYYNNPGHDFYEQAMNSPYYNEDSKNVYMESVITIQDFVEVWNSMSGTIDYVYLYLHGGKGVLYFKGDTFGFSTDLSFSNLEAKTVKKKIYLLSCKGGAGDEGNNVAWMFAKLTKAEVYACTGSVSYSKIFGDYYARKAADLGIIKTFYYQKRYMFWGRTVAKSAPGQW